MENADMGEKSQKIDELKESIGIIIPTYNHPSYMSNWFEIFQTQNEKSGIEVWVYDSSEGDETEKICNIYKEFVHYVRCDSKLIADVKALRAIAEVDKKYLWMCGDGIIVNPDLVYDIVLDAIDKEMDVIHFLGFNRTNNKYSEKKNLSDVTVYEKGQIKEFFRDFWWSIATWGVSIIKKEILADLDIEEELFKFQYPYWLYPAMIFEGMSLAERPKGVVYRHNCFTPNREKKSNTWKVKGKTIKIWTDATVSTINGMSDYYEEYKVEVIQNCWQNNGFMTKDGLKNFKKEELYTINDYFKYRKNLKIVSGLSDFELLKIALF